MQQYLQNKEGLVENVFNKVYDKYDLMNDFMSFGAHRIWKKNLLSWMNPVSNKTLVDVACGTGDIGKLYLDITSNNCKIFCIDPNISMIKKGKSKLMNYKNIKWLVNSAEKLSLKENSNLESSKAEIGWGHQIRSYVLQPYKLVKDNRTNFESTSPEKILNGEIDDFLEESLYQIK